MLPTELPAGILGARRFIASIFGARFAFQRVE
jgi:hypothetical protein